MHNDLLQTALQIIQWRMNFFFFTSFLFPGTKKALQMDLESLLTHYV